MFSKLQLYFHTLRYLKARQFLGRFWHRFYQPGVPPYAAMQLRVSKQSFSGSQRLPSMTGPNEFIFLNQQHQLLAAADWNSPKLPLLWRYNLHYFDDLAASDAENRLEWHQNLINRWVSENPPVVGAGWDAYPISLRIVNWIKFHLKTEALDVTALGSLVQQVRWLRQRLEYHLLGNHLWANGKALVFAGCFFESLESEKWLRRGLKIISKEINEQILPDGGHFERSPMYHAILLEDLLDLIQLANCYPALISSNVVLHWRDRVQSMLGWLQIMTHPDGELSFFNDATMGIAPGLSSLSEYARQLDIIGDVLRNESTLLSHSGYARLQSSTAVLLADVGLIGPDYLPGHAHADTLSFELSLFGQRVFVNQGIDRYGADEERLRQRGTAAHNTVVVDGQNSSEVWSGFRVARRARPFDLQAGLDSDPLSLRCSHSGYHRLRGRVTHTRVWQLAEGLLSIADSLSGHWHEAVATLHLHPNVFLLDYDQSSCNLRVGQEFVQLSVEGGILTVLDGTYHPGFGLSQKCISLRVMLKGDNLLTRLKWMK